VSLSRVSSADLARSITLRQQRDPLRFFEPASPEQEEALRASGKGLLCLGGNRSGKSMVGAVRCVLKATGRTLSAYPDLKFKRARYIWCVSQDLPGQAARDGVPEEPHTQLEALKRWVPQDALRGGSWARAYSPGAFVLTLAGGCKILFKSYDQGLLQFESAAVDHIWFDEEPTQAAIFSSCLLRLVDRRGTWDMTLTPVLSLQGKTGIAEALWEGRDAGKRGESAHGQYETVQLLTSRNVHLPPEEVASLDRLPEEEKQVRLYGAFARLGGRVLSEFDPGRHLVDDHLPSRDLKHYLIIDPGWKVAAHLFAAVDTRGHVTLYAEHYARQQPIPERMRILHMLWQAFGKPAFDVIVDAASFYRTRQGGTSKELPSDVDEYRRAALICGAEWFQPRPCVKEDPNAYRVKRYLAVGKMAVCRSLRNWLWEQERWTWKREREGPVASENPQPDAPKETDDHMMDCVTGDTLITVGRFNTLCQVRADQLAPGDLALTRDGCRKIRAHWRTGIREVYRITFSDGRSLTATANHPVWVEGLEWQDVVSLRTGAVVQSISAWRRRNGMGGSGIGIPMRPEVPTGTTTSEAGNFCTSPSGRRRGDSSPSDMRSTIGTETPAITLSTIWSALPDPSIGAGTRSEAPTRQSEIAITARPRMPRGPGTVLLKGENGIVSTPRIEQQPGSRRSLPATGAEPCIAPSAPDETGSVTLTAAPLRVVSVERLKQPQAVFNLQVADVPEFYANGVLVHNCTRYLCNELGDPDEEPEPWLAPSSVQQHWKDELRELDRGEGVSEWYG
jgi:phage terminase large subunit-like protein